MFDPTGYPEARQGVKGARSIDRVHPNHTMLLPACVLALVLPAVAQMGGGGHGIWRYSAAAMADKVTSLPGMPSGITFDQYAGFVSVTRPGEDPTVRREIFYWFVESQRDPINDPLMLWTNGGPGCSGLLGKLTEMGPFRSVNNGTALDFMPYAWNREANIIFVEQPLFTGFSISDDEADAITTDVLNAERLTKFLDGWLDRFPGFRSTDFFLSSESYGGHYVPNTAQAILNHNAAQLASGLPTIKLRGAMLGNPYTAPLENAVGMLDAAWGHGLLPTDKYLEWRERCPETATRMATADDGYLYSYSYSDSGEATPFTGDPTLCYTDGWALYRTWVGGDAEVNPYALAYPTCEEPERMGGGSGYMQRFRLFSLLQQQAGARIVGDNVTAPMRPLYGPCGEDFMTKYLNRADVREALHIDHDRPWAPCDDPLFDGYDEASHNAPQMPLWTQIIRNTDWAQLRMPPLKLLIFSGDNDAICGVHGTQRWITKVRETDALFRPPLPASDSLRAPSPRTLSPRPSPHHWPRTPARAWRA